MTTKLSTSTLDLIESAVDVPRYDRGAVSAGIVHFGVGGFHRAHEAMYLDRILAGGDTEWGICGVGVQPSDIAMRDALGGQDGLYTLVTRSPDGAELARVIGSIVDYLYAPDDPGAVIRRLADPATRIVSLTITEGGYGVNDVSGEFDFSAPGIAHDLEPDVLPTTVFGYLTQALAIRRDVGIPPFTVMSCDNIQGNGTVARAALTAFASRKDAELGAWIAEQVAFPNSMVDRITPATTDALRAELAERYGIEDAWPVGSEAFAQWVLEDRFTLGRPALESVGVQLVDDVEPYEQMKLRLLNASHQALGYLGILAGYDYVHEAVGDEAIAAFVLGYMTEEASPTLRPVPGIDLAAYRLELLSRFSNTAIADTLARQVVDGSERIAKFVLPVARDLVTAGGSVRHIGTILAAWSVYVEQDDALSEAHTIHDVRREALLRAVALERTVPGAFLDLSEVFGALGQDPALRGAYLGARERILADGPLAAIRTLTDGEPS